MRILKGIFALSLGILATLLAVLFVRSFSEGQFRAGNNETDSLPKAEATMAGTASQNEGEDKAAVATIEKQYAYSELSGSSESTEGHSGDGGTEKEDKYKPILPRFAEWLEINPYVAGWLTIENSDLDLPVVYTPVSQNYFLHRAIDGSESERGTLFIADIWRKECNNTLIYGHNMRDGSSFGMLLNYADPEYGREHSNIYFDTLYEEGDYELVAAFYSQIDEEELETEADREAADQAIEEAGLEERRRKEEEQKEAEGEKEAPEGEQESGGEGEEHSEGDETLNEPAEERPLTLAELNLYADMGDEDIYCWEKDMDEGRFRYYYYTDLSERDDFEYYVQHVKDLALYDTGVDVSWGDQLLTLSTCSYQTKNGRFVVVAKKKR